MTTLHKFRGVRYTTTELADMSGIPATTVYQRIMRGWTVEQAVCIPSPEQIKRGVVFNFPPFEGTGAGSTAQEIPEITFSQNEVSP